MRNRAADLLFVLVGMLNLLPGLGALSVARLEQAYGITIGDPNLALLMRHRAVLFVIVGAMLVLAGAGRSVSKPVAATAGLASMGSYCLIAFGIDGLNAELERIFVADLVGIVLLSIGWWLAKAEAVSGAGERGRT